MLFAYVPKDSALEQRRIDPDAPIPGEAIWLDLVNPGPGEERPIERMLGIEVPTREEMQEIEVSSRLYVASNARFMTATLMCNSDTPTPKTAAVTFILTRHCLLTVRYDEPRPFAIVAGRLTRSCPAEASGESVLMELLEAVIDRAADILERVGVSVDKLSHDIFDPTGERPVRGTAHYEVLKSIGAAGDITSKARESLVSIGRLLLFLVNEADGMRWTKDVRTHLISMQRDVQSLTDHSSYLGGKVTFLLSGMLGVVQVEQNNVIKIFSVAAVAMLPPTLIASIYGMNFKHMPELEWTYGYPFALGLIVIAGILPYAFFKWKKWL